MYAVLPCFIALLAAGTTLAGPSDGTTRSIPLQRRALSHIQKRYLSAPEQLSLSIQRPLQRVAAKYQRNLEILAAKVGEAALKKHGGAGPIRGGVKVPAPPVDLKLPVHGPRDVIDDGRRSHLGKRYSPGHRMMMHHSPAFAVRATSKKQKEKEAREKAQKEKEKKAKEKREREKKKREEEEKEALEKAKAASKASASRASASKASASRASASKASASRLSTSLAAKGSVLTTVTSTSKGAKSTITKTVKRTTTTPQATKTGTPVTGAVGASTSNEASLIDIDQDGSWMGPMYLGTPSVETYAVFDTGSSDLWTTSTDCTASTCAPNAKFNPSSSSTYKVVNNNAEAFSIIYGDGSNATGPVGKDTVRVAGIVATGQGLSPVTAEGGFNGVPFQGIAGMAFPDLANISATPPWFFTMVNEGHITTPQFSFRLAPYYTSDPSSLYLGGLDPNLYRAGTTEWHNVQGEWWWNITSTPMLNGTKTAAGNIGAIIDTGTTAIVGPVASVKKFYESFDVTVYDVGGGYYVLACDSMPPLEFQFEGGRKWGVTNYTLAEFEYQGREYCYSAVVGLDLGVGSNTWILGDSFLKYVYATFDIKRRQVGFSKLS